MNLRFQNLEFCWPKKKFIYDSYNWVCWPWYMHVFIVKCGTRPKFTCHLSICIKYMYFRAIHTYKMYKLSKLTRNTHTNKHFILSQWMVDFVEWSCRLDTSSTLEYFVSAWIIYLLKSPLTVTNAIQISIIYSPLWPSRLDWPNNIIR